MGILISGIGRSGTTAMYEVVGKALLAKHPAGRCVYEPYLWNIPEIESTAIAFGQPFDMNQVGPYNIFVHCNTPLFLKSRNDIHDQWLETIYGSDAYAKKDVMAKVIRGTGRLESYITRYTNIKIILSVRNPLDTINSSLGIFSFFGDEFYPSDKKRFTEEVRILLNKDIQFDSASDELFWSLHWWRVFTEYGFMLAKKHPDNILLVPYEVYDRDKVSTIKKVLRFCNIGDQYLNESALEKPAGSRTSVRYLSDKMLASMGKQLDWYLNTLRMHSVLIDVDSFKKDLNQKYARRQFVESMLLKEKTSHTAVMWRIKYKNDLSFVQDLKRREKQYTVGNALADFESNDKPIRLSRGIATLSPKKSRSKTLGVLITSFNNKNTISECIYSVISQSKRPDLIYIADDCSTDGSQDILKNLKERYPEIEICLRPGNVGVSANRDLALRAMDVDFITTLDGDDLFFPGKLELEFNKLVLSSGKVVFSDIGRVDDKGTRLLSTHEYSGVSVQEALEKMLSRSVQVPRDMMLSKSLYLATGGFDVSLNIYEDWALKMRLALAAKDEGWMWSGGIGTVYNRLIPGLSKKPNVFHAHGQLLALSRNASALGGYPTSLIKGIEHCMKFMNEKPKVRFSEMLKKYKNKENVDPLVGNLSHFWQTGYFGSDPNKRLADLDRVIL